MLADDHSRDVDGSTRPDADLRAVHQPASNPSLIFKVGWVNHHSNTVLMKSTQTAQVAGDRQQG